MESYNESAHSFLKRALLKLLLAVTVLLALTCVHIIPTGCTGVRTICGQIDQKPVQSGRIIYTIPLVEHIETVNNKQQEFKVEDKIWGETNDKTPVYADDVVVTYQIAVERSAWIYPESVKFRLRSPCFFSDLTGKLLLRSEKANSPYG